MGNLEAARASGATFASENTLQIPKCLTGQADALSKHVQICIFLVAFELMLAIFNEKLSYHLWKC